jgi:hypothetical protein
MVGDSTIGFLRGKVSVNEAGSEISLEWSRYHLNKGGSKKKI